VGERRACWLVGTGPEVFCAESVTFFEKPWSRGGLFVKKRLLEMQVAAMRGMSKRRNWILVSAEEDIEVI